MDAPLHCGDCQECCRGPNRTPVLLNPKTELGKYPTVSIAVPDGPTFHFLSSRDSTDCPFVTDSGCAIYATRPEACRNFDCRDHVDDAALPSRMRVEALRRIPVENGAD
jgi:Fe-S-cluster containining protein